MATHKSAKKRARQALRRRERNRQSLSSVKTVVKQFKAAIASGEGKDALTNLFTTAQTALAKAAQKGILHSNNASRTISRLAKSLSRAGETAGAAKETKKPSAKKAPAAKKAAAAKAKTPSKKSTPAKKKK